MDLSELTEFQIATGEPAPSPSPRVLRAGALEMTYEAGFARDVRVGPVEIVRMINFAVRDRDWGTVPFVREDETIEQEADGFQVAYRACFKADGIAYEAWISIRGEAPGRLSLQFDGVARESFWRNRIGFTVLHPPACAGLPVTVSHADGEETRGRFPTRISPHQPFLSVAAMCWEVEGLKAVLRFEGEVFEMEDQRNWTDASFKTYGTPLALPFPVEVPAGERLRQAILLEVSGRPPEKGGGAEAGTVQLGRPGNSRPRPLLGMARASGHALADREKAWLRELKLDQYRVELDPAEANWSGTWDAALGEARELRAKLEVVLTLGSAAELDPVLARLREGADHLGSLLLLGRDAKCSPPALVEEAVPRLRQALPGVRLGGGTDAFFAELNREPVPPEALDFLSFSINPQVHAFDRRSIVETLEAQSEAVASARELAGEAAVRVSPVSLRMRWNPNATGPAKEPAPGAMPDDVDPRQGSLFVAGWALGGIAAMASAGVAAATFFETVGERGIITSERARYPDAFPWPEGAALPVYFVFRELAGASSLRPVATSQPLRASALWCEHPTGPRLLVANHTGEGIRVALPSGFRAHRWRLLNATAWRRIALHPEAYREILSASFEDHQCELPAYSFACVEGAFAEG